MPLKEYLINCLLEDKSIIDELLLIDNRVQYTSLTYENILNNLKNAVVYDNLDVVSSYIAITDGEIDSVLKVLINVKELKTVYIDRSFLGINKYLVKCVNDFYGEEKIVLDDSKDYRKYINNSPKIVLSGFDTFVEELSKEFNECDVTIL